MGKFRQTALDASHTDGDIVVRLNRELQRHQHLLQLVLPPPPPLQPRPDLLTSVEDTEEDEPSSAFAASDEPLDYSMKSLLSPKMPTSPAAKPKHHHQPQPQSGEQVLHKLRHVVLQKRDVTGCQLQTCGPALHTQHQPKQLQHHHQQLAELKLTIGKLQQPSSSLNLVSRQAQGGSPSSAMLDSDTETKAAYAADCIKSRLEGCGKRVHLFLGILLHFGMPPGPSGELIFDRVIAFSDENKNLSNRPTAYFMVLDSKLLALIWCKFKGNSSNEYSTLTRAIRSTRQKYKGIFETVENPGKKLYKFGPMAVDQFRQLFPTSYADKRELA